MSTIGQSGGTNNTPENSNTSFWKIHRQTILLVCQIVAALAAVAGAAGTIAALLPQAPAGCTDVGVGSTCKAGKGICRSSCGISEFENGHCGVPECLCCIDVPTAAPTTEPPTTTIDVPITTTVDTTDVPTAAPTTEPPTTTIAVLITTAGDATDVPTTAPTTTTGALADPEVSSVIGNDATPTKLTVTLEKPTTPICIGNVTVYTITTLPGGTPVEIDDSDAISTDLTGLQPCTDYTVEVAAKCSEGTGATGTMPGTTGSKAPGKPTSTTLISNDPDKISVSWVPSDVSQSCPVTGYTVSWTPKGGAASTQDVEKDATSYPITGLTCNTAYTITVTAKTGDGKTAESDQMTQTTADQAPGVVSDPAASAVSNEPNQLAVTWKAGKYDCGGGLSGYLLTWEVEGESKSYTTGPSVTTYTIPGLQPCTKYTVNVAASSQTNISSPEVTVTGTTGIQAPSAPNPNIVDESSTTSSLLVSWTQIAVNNCPITKYLVEWSAESGDGSASDIGDDKTVFNITGLICNTDYTITITAYTSEDKLTKSTTITGTTHDEACSDRDELVSIGGVGYAVINDKRYTWSEAEARCRSDGLILAEPKNNAKEVVAYLWDNYYPGFKSSFGTRFWFGGRATLGVTFAWVIGGLRTSGVTFTWVSSGDEIPGYSPLWWPGGGPGEGCRSPGDCCLGSGTEAHPYIARPCSHTRYVLCQCP